jgi:hypothetical protein
MPPPGVIIAVAIAVGSITVVAIAVGSIIAVGTVVGSIIAVGCVIAVGTEVAGTAVLVEVVSPQAVISMAAIKATGSSLALLLIPFLFVCIIFPPDIVWCYACVFSGHSG